MAIKFGKENENQITIERRKWWEEQKNLSGKSNPIVEKEMESFSLDLALRRVKT